MKIELSVRDIEIILSLLSEVTMDEYGMMSNSSSAMEEFALLDKLETALKRGLLMERELLDTSGSNLCH